MAGVPVPVCRVHWLPLAGSGSGARDSIPLCGLWDTDEREEKFSLWVNNIC